MHHLEASTASPVKPGVVGRVKSSSLTAPVPAAQQILQYQPGLRPCRPAIDPRPGLSIRSSPGRRRRDLDGLPEALPEHPVFPDSKPRSLWSETTGRVKVIFLGRGPSVACVEGERTWPESSVFCKPSAPGAGSPATPAGRTRGTPRPRPAPGDLRRPRHAVEKGNAGNPLAARGESHARALLAGPPQWRPTAH